MHSSSGLSALAPNAAMKVRDTGARFKLGLITCDKDGRKWGIGVRHVFGEAASCEVADENGRSIGVYLASENLHDEQSHDVSNQLVKFALHEHLSLPAETAFETDWPASVGKVGELLGHDVHLAHRPSFPCGQITRVDGVFALSVRHTKERQLLTGVAELTLDDEGILGRGAAGTLFISDYAETVGLAIASLRSEKGLKVFLGRIDRFLERHALILWRPPFSDWSGVSERISLFSQRADAVLASWSRVASIGRDQ